MIAAAARVGEVRMLQFRDARALPLAAGIL